MPGPVSDSYDPEFGTATDANEVEEAVTAIRDKVSRIIGDEKLRPILEVVREKRQLASRSPLRLLELAFTEQEMRILRFALNRALESL